MKELKNTSSSPYYQMRPSTSQPNVYINNNGDRLHIISPTQLILNSKKFHNASDMLTAVGKIGKK